MQVEQWKDGKLLSTESVTDVEDAAAEPDDDWDDDEQARPSVPLAFSDAWTATLHVDAEAYSTEYRPVRARTGQVFGMECSSLGGPWPRRVMPTARHSR